MSSSAIHQLLYYSIHSILFHRTVYTREEFDITSKYGQTQYILADFQTTNYIETFLSQVDVWIEKGEITHLILIILAKDDGRTLERWTFDISSRTVPILQPPKPKPKAKSTPHKAAPVATPSATKGDDNEDASDVAVPNILKQIAAATTMLPDLPTPGVFTLQGYVSNDDEVGGMVGEWTDAGEEGSYSFADVEVQQVMLRGLKSSNREVDLLLTALDD